MKEQNRVQWVYSSHDNRELEERYDQWAKEYDSDLERRFGYKAPEYAAETLARFVPKEGRILDAGAGTGLVGDALSKLGYYNLTGMDLSQGMLEEARGKRVYQEVHRMVMGEPLGYASNSFDAVVCVGTLTLGHAPASSLDELVRITKSGGHIIFTLRPDVYHLNGFKEKQTGLESAGRWTLAEVGKDFQPLPQLEPDVRQQVWVYQVNDR